MTTDEMQDATAQRKGETFIDSLEATPEGVLLKFRGPGITEEVANWTAAVIRDWLSAARRWKEPVNTFSSSFSCRNLRN